MEVKVEDTVFVIRVAESDCHCSCENELGIEIEEVKSICQDSKKNTKDKEECANLGIEEGKEDRVGDQRLKQRDETRGDNVHVMNNCMQDENVSLVSRNAETMCGLDVAQFELEHDILMSSGEPVAVHMVGLRDKVVESILNVLCAEPIP
ncbi:hypothetical protein V6N13_048206 [Hibiscus sabdariffa]|uniref:Uncharacterized protein n=2 Tax=Hibiscus sabdariffa TaxID=183260 RepID=A0ABR1ZAG3_9ROSI